MANTSWETVLSEALGAFMAQKLAFTIGDVAVTISAVSGGPPKKFDMPTALFAAENVFLGQTGVLQLGAVQVTIAPQAPSESSATPESAAMAAAIAASVTPSGPAATPAAPAPVAAAGQTSSIQPGPPGYEVHTFGHATP